MFRRPPEAVARTGRYALHNAVVDAVGKVGQGLYLPGSPGAAEMRSQGWSRRARTQPRWRTHPGDRPRPRRPGMGTLMPSGNAREASTVEAVCRAATAIRRRLAGPADGSRLTFMTFCSVRNSRLHTGMKRRVGGNYARSISPNHHRPRSGRESGPRGHLCASGKDRRRGPGGVPGSHHAGFRQFAPGYCRTIGRSVGIPRARPRRGTRYRDRRRDVHSGTAGNGGKVRNTLLVTGRGVEASYDKIHLFDAFGFAESDTVDAGTDPATFELDGVTSASPPATTSDSRTCSPKTRIAAPT